MPAKASAQKKPTKPRAPRKAKAVNTATISEVHETSETVAAVELTPPHPPREDTPEYEQTHKLLVFDKDTPCKVCGVKHSTIGDSAANKAGSKALETHHFPCERSLLFALDWRKVHNDFPEVYNQHSLEVWIDSPRNMLVLCDVHHRGVETGIHHLLTQDFAVLPYLREGYKVAATAKDAAQVLAADEQIEQQSGAEAEVKQDIAAGVDPTATAPATIAKRPKRSRKAPKAGVAA